MSPALIEAAVGLFTIWAAFETNVFVGLAVFAIVMAVLFIH